MGTMVTFTFWLITSKITETVDAVTKTSLLILADIRRAELVTQMAVTGTSTEIHEHVNNAQMIYEYT